MPSRPVILSLFDYSGHWPFYFARNGYDVIQVDIKRGQDIMTYQPPRNVYGILAAPPCTHFASSGARYFSTKDADGRTQQAVDLVTRTMEIIKLARPAFWMLENPVGRLSTIIGPPVSYFDPCDFAGYAPDPRSNRYTKKTCLWGDFDLPRPLRLDPILWTYGGSHSNFLWAMLGSKSERTKAMRSQTPLGFAYATYLGNRIRTASNLTAFPAITYTP